MNAVIDTSELQRAMARYLDHKRSLGHRCRHETWLLDSIRRHVAQSGGSDLDAVGFHRWSSDIQHLHANTRRKYQQILQHFCRYRCRSEPACFVPSDAAFAKPQPYVNPTLVEPEQIGRMLAIASGLPSTSSSPLRGPALHLAIVLLYTCGLRLGELLRLTLGDVEDNGSVLRIRESKFHKSRLVPLSASASEALRDYLNRRATLDRGPAAPLLCNRKGGRLHPYSHSGMQGAIGRLFEVAGVVGERNRRPRVHDLRHSFAVQALIRWYRAGADVQSKLPMLALYMGHVSIESSAYYLHWVPTLRNLASSRYEARFGHLIQGGGL